MAPAPIRRGDAEVLLFEVEGAPEPRETDVVIYSPGYPRKLRGREEVLAGGVAAAFNVRLTLNADGIRDGVERAAEMRRYLKPRYETVRGELLGAYPVGLLAHSHDWKGESPRDTMTDALRQRDRELAQHPRECLDFACVANLGAWVATASTGLDMGDGPMVMTSMQAAHPELSQPGRCVPHAPTAEAGVGRSDHSADGGWVASPRNPRVRRRGRTTMETCGRFQ
jgi:hypothetical protein